MLDILITGAKVYDGTGNPWFRADVGVRGERIGRVGPVRERARRRMDAAGLVLCPGFIDVHTHADGILERPGADNFLRQGVTTVISGNCGFSGFPVKKILAEVEAVRPAINYGTLVGHGELRRRAMGLAGRRPRPREMAEMLRLAEAACRQGALGLSTGLFYVPGAYARTEEIIALARVFAARGGVYASHKRSAGGKMFEALREAARVGREAGISVQVSHLKVLHRRGRTRKDRAERALDVIRRYRREGVDITFDVHPFPATFTSLSAVLIPPRVSEGGRLTERLRSDAVRRKIRDRVAGRLAWIGGAGKITIASFPPDRSAEGRSLAEVARSRGRDAVQAAMDLVAEGGPDCIFHALRPGDVSTILCCDLGMIASDGEIPAPRGGLVHPRSYGTFPRVLREYVRERGLLGLEEAIRKMTSLPARKFGLALRGMVAEGMKADLVLLDPRRVAERSTFEAPRAFPAGIRRVIVGGKVAWNGRSVSKRRSGEVIRCR